MIEIVEYNIQYFASEVAHNPVNTRNKMTFFFIYPSSLRACCQLRYQGVLRSSPNQHCFH